MAIPFHYHIWVKRIDIKKSKLQSFHDFKQCCRFLQIPKLKPHVRHQRVYGMGTNSVMLIPILLPHNVLPNAQNAGSADKRTRPGAIHRTMDPLLKRSPIQNGRPSYIGAYVRTKCTSQNSSRARNSVVWHTSQSPHAIWCSPTRPHRYWRRDWLCDSGWTLGYGPMRYLYFLTQRSLPYSRMETGNSQAHKFSLRNLRLKYV